MEGLLAAERIAESSGIDYAHVYFDREVSIETDSVEFCSGFADYILNHYKRNNNANT
tara:strand:- start:40165 stop:40335 length:171 start_codon:yes stop_codon:yes gene_type:complete